MPTGHRPVACREASLEAFLNRAVTTPLLHGTIRVQATVQLHDVRHEEAEKRLESKKCYKLRGIAQVLS